ncbi:MAG: glycosyltransferase family 9 protein [Flavisolibacter sp.]
MKILVRLPNWLGDMVMSVAFIDQLPHYFPGAEVSVIAKKGIHELLPYFPPTQHQFVFSKEEFPGMKGLWRFGRQIARKEKFDLFFCLPNSFSSAFMGYATGIPKRIGYKQELREIFLTHAYSRPKNIHRVEEYIALLESYTGNKPLPASVQMHHKLPKKEHIVININSEASSRRLTVTKAVSLLNAVRGSVTNPVILIGAPKESTFVEEVLGQLVNKKDIWSVAGKTSLPQLVETLAGARLMLSTDSGPAHLANALGTHTIVLFGAGDENNTAPYNKAGRTIIRLGKLSCEPCQKNVCVQFGIPQCLELLEPEIIIQKMLQRL